MSTVTITADAIEVRLHAAEKAATLRGNLRVPRTAVSSVEVVEDALAATAGLRIGLGVPGHRKLGTWHSLHGKEFVDVRKGQSAVRIRLAGHQYDSLLLGVDDPQAIVRTLDA
ncbi:hypothetical protein SAMN05444365_101318 [Micromonospora pattaloongensis]|uniref:Bacterial Pleckstrin homology domain-containing protein n=1 Tax=Micromonospora pattaloongensis TaxID=405436 RepID=A0A1H3GA63_9ACTN|nr:hypothetical protein [Micromonospora pattaloongensis]SDX99384.1 hypothetical protein SAMN05444365_101318 [Micromonospora pattaloongensis]